MGEGRCESAPTLPLNSLPLLDPEAIFCGFGLKQSEEEEKQGGRCSLPGTAAHIQGATSSESSQGPNQTQLGQLALWSAPPRPSPGGLPECHGQLKLVSASQLSVAGNISPPGSEWYLCSHPHVATLGKRGHI